jgi:regulation of enolase protein 1 (concanavalin A-like superfamily)
MMAGLVALSGTGVVWTDVDVGMVGAAGSSILMGGTFQVRGAGGDIWGSNDAFHFVQQAIAGDATITARVTGVQNTQAWAKAGLMMRDGTAVNARNAFTFVTPSAMNAYRFQRRVTAGGSTSTAGAGAGTTPTWLRLVRRGNVFTSSFSADGATWTVIDPPSTIMNTPATLNVGLVVTSHVAGTLNTSTFDSVAISQP